MFEKHLHLTRLGQMSFNEIKRLSQESDLEAPKGRDLCLYLRSTSLGDVIVEEPGFFPLAISCSTIERLRLTLFTLFRFKKQTKAQNPLLS